MIRVTFALAAALTVGVGAGTAQAQCGCARPSASTGRLVPSNGLKYSPPAPVSRTAVRPAACCARGPAVTFVGHSFPVVAPACPHGAASQPTAGHAGHAAAVTSGDSKPAVTADKEVTLTGNLVCAKCGLKEPGVKKCTNALQVKDGEVTLTYFLSDKGNGEDYHEALCGGGTKAGTKVTGTVTEKDDKRWVKATKVEVKK